MKQNIRQKAKRKEKKGQPCDWLINPELYFWPIRSRTKVWSFRKHDFSRLLWPLHNWLIGLATDPFWLDSVTRPVSQDYGTRTKSTFLSNATKQTTLIERRSGYVTLPSYQNFWMTTKQKRPLKSEFERFQISSTLSNFFFICLFYLKGPYLSFKVFFVVFTYSIKRAREISNFHVAVVQRRQRNVEKAWCTCKVVVLLIYTYCFFVVLVADDTLLLSIE